MPFDNRFDVAIIGGGLFGAALASHLVAYPGARVVVLDAGSIPRYAGSTRVSAGVSSVQGWDPWDLGIVEQSRREYLSLAESEGAEPPRTNGGIRIARTPEGARWLDRCRALLRREEVVAKEIDSGELRELIPFGDFSDVERALLTPDDATFSASSLRDAYAQRAVRAGAHFHASRDPVPPARWEEGRWRIEGDLPVLADQVVVAAGPWSRSWLARSGFDLPLAPFRAQALVARPRSLRDPFPTLHDLDLALYVRIAPHGRILVGDGTGIREEDPERWDPAADPAFVDSIRAMLTGVFPTVSPFQIERSWAGLCVASPDRYPLVGRVPGATGLYVASGFNGFGAMRAGCLARRLGAAMRTDRWDALLPADPGRFAATHPTFAPLPEFPLESEEELSKLPPRFDDPLGPVFPEPSADANGVEPRRLVDLAAVDRLRWSPLSEWFDPLLPTFAKDAIRTGGSAEVFESDGRVQGLGLLGSSEGVGSVFTRRRSIADRYLSSLPAGGVYLEYPWRAGGDPVEILAADLRDWRPSIPLRNPIRLARPEDLPRVRSLMRSEIGPGVDPWIATLPRSEETGFLCEIEGRVVGVSWLSRAGPYARGHSFAVHPRFQRLGIGTDLLTARMLWLQRTGGLQVVSEIYGENVGSRTAAERAGMSRVGRMYHVRPVGPPGPKP